MTLIESRGETHAKETRPSNASVSHAEVQFESSIYLLDRSATFEFQNYPFCLILQKLSSKPEMKNFAS